MLVTAGSLDGLVGFAFGAAQFADVTVTSFAQAADGGVMEVLAQTTGATAALAAGNAASTYSVAAINDSAGQVQISQFGGGVFVRAGTYNVLGYNVQSLLVSSLSLSELIAALLAGQSIAGQIAAIATTALPAGSYLAFSPGGGFTGALACFARGTRILTAGGEVAVEDVRVGDLVRGRISGRLRRVRWVGGRMIDIRRHPRPWDVAPVRIRAGALAAGVPRRDLRLSPDHAVLIGGVLIPARYLLNGATVVQEWPARIDYRHIELEAHDVLLAEGLACESFLDTGNRAALTAASRYWRPPARVLGTVGPQHPGGPP